MKMDGKSLPMRECGLKSTHALIKKTEENGLKVDSMLLGEQMRVISEKRIIEKVGKITDCNSLKEIRRVYEANFGE